MVGWEKRNHCTSINYVQTCFHKLRINQKKSIKSDVALTE